ncbi:hypothetical protein B0H14DRAFT_3151764 [Mycena olivaceomarginata]|nr:hypothetical protein B0H14DRAFT_3151764 [Mycena olivaceomarginata]
MISPSALGPNIPLIPKHSPNTHPPLSLSLSLSRCHAKELMGGQYGVVLRQRFLSASIGPGLPRSILSQLLSLAATPEEPASGGSQEYLKARLGVTQHEWPALSREERTKWELEKKTKTVEIIVSTPHASTTAAPAHKKNPIPRLVSSDFYFRDGSTSLIRTIARLRARIWSGGFDYIASLSTGFQTSPSYRGSPGYGEDVRNKSSCKRRLSRQRRKEERKKLVKMKIFNEGRDGGSGGGGGHLLCVADRIQSPEKRAVKVEAGREVAKVRRAAEAMIWPPDTGRSSQARHLPNTTADLDSAGACLHDQRQLHLPLSVSLSGKLVQYRRMVRRKLRHCCRHGLATITSGGALDGGEGMSVTKKGSEMRVPPVSPVVDDRTVATRLDFRSQYRTVHLDGDSFDKTCHFIFRT